MQRCHRELRLIRFSFVAALALGLALAAGCSKKEEATRPAQPKPAATKPVVQAPEPEPLEPLPLEVHVDKDKVLLGRQLFFDTALSKDGTLSCTSCHQFDHGGADPRVVSPGVGGTQGAVNSPTVLNSALNFRQFWDGRAANLDEQALGPVENPVEMATTFPDVVQRLEKKPQYVAEFGKLYKDGITKTNIVNAIAEYEKSLITPSRFDRYLRGDKGALTPLEKEGYETFKSVGCTSCHVGQNVGGTMYQKMGLVRDYFEDRGHVTEADYGRYNATHVEADKFFFKVPTLRNVALTAPYFHDGSAKTLDQAVRTMGKYQLGRDLTDEQVKAIVAFLGSLTGVLPPWAKQDGSFGDAFSADGSTLTLPVAPATPPATGETAGEKAVGEKAVGEKAAGDDSAGEHAPPPDAKGAEGTHAP
ncbi:MAG: cytochrome-c peroxidase [Myxococcales bacterium]|nr:cytochrome-c peroxidase [Myxococcales bacterium]